MPVPDKLARIISDASTCVRLFQIVSFCSSILFAVISGVTWISLLIIFSDDILLALIIGLLVLRGRSATRLMPDCLAGQTI